MDGGQARTPWECSPLLKEPPAFATGSSLWSWLRPEVVVTSCSGSTRERAPLSGNLLGLYSPCHLHEAPTP